ncbi:MAG: helix-turn-helix domain-containing protein [Parasporobacterium sp.]|nr:helix-turn-helix domain-containing protein [Parasporobacterium sp.]
MKTGQPAAKPSIPIVCRQIRRYREKAGLEQKNFARKIGITPNAVSNWENGRGRPDINLLPDICAALDITLYQLFAMDDPSVSSCSPEEQALAARYRSLSPGHKFAVSQIIDTLIRVQDAENCPKIRKLIYFEKSLSAGFGDPTEFDTQGEPFYLYSSVETDRADYVFKVNGDSMEPAYHSEDMVLVSRISGSPALRPGDVGAFIAGNETYIKIYREDGLHSLNPKYAPLRFEDGETVYLIGRVTGILSPDRIARRADIEKYLLLHPEVS